MTTNTRLNKKHRRDLRNCGLHADVREAARFYSITDPAKAARLLGWEGIDGPAPALAIPIFDRRGRVVTTILRPDTPHKRMDGRAPKYEWPKGVGSRLYFPPTKLVPSSAWEDRSIPLILTEGVKKAVAAASCGSAAIAASGVYMFHNAAATARGESPTLHPDFAGVPLDNRVVYVAFDGGDTSENVNVVHAEARLARMLMNAHATVRLIRIPFEAGKGKVGLDDYLASSKKPRRALSRLLDQCTIAADPLERLASARAEKAPPSAIRDLLSEPSFLASLDAGGAPTKDLVAAELLKASVRRDSLDEAVSRFREQLALKMDRDSDEDVSDPDMERKALRLLKKPDLMDRFIRRAHSDGLVGEEVTAKLLLLVCTSRKLPQPIHAMLKAQTSAGKSSTVEHVTRYLPKGDVHNVSEISTRALQYLQQNLDGKVVVFSEFEGAQRASYTLRTAQTEGHLTTWSVQKTEAGKLGTEKFTVGTRGAFISTTTHLRLDPQNESRILELSIDESTDQTRRINMRKARDAAKPASDEKRARQDHRRAIWRTAMGMIKSYEVRVPDAEELAREFPSDRVRHRRDFPRLLSLIKACTLLHQYQRQPPDKDGHLVSTKGDVSLVLEISKGLFASGGTEQTNIVESLRGAFPPGTRFSAKQAAVAVGGNEDVIRKQLHVLAQSGVVKHSERGRGRSPSLWEFPREGDQKSSQEHGAGSPD